jgi:hypothetical protein
MMTPEQKNLLLKELCARLPYHVIVEYKGANVDLMQYARSVKLESCKPYLRPMSNMTAEEEYEYHQCKNIDYLEICEMEHTEMLKTTALCFSHAIDWLNAHHFDYRGLIEKGLALEAPKDMYYG